MNELGRRTLRLWAVLDVGYALLVAGLASWAVPWKTPAANAAALVYAAALLVGAPGLWRQRRWAWRLGVVTSLLGLGAGVVVVGGLVASWAYLRAIYGAFGVGASLVALMLAATAFQVLGLYPAIRLRALLRGEVRSDLASARRATLAAWCLVALPFPVAGAVHARFALEPAAPLADDLLLPAMTLVRSASEGKPANLPADAAARLAEMREEPESVHVRWFVEGSERARAAGAGNNLAVALAAAGRSLGAAVGSGPVRGSLRIDRTVARGPLPSWGPALTMGLNPGRDGVASRGLDAPVVLPDEPVREGRVGTSAPVAALDELRVGIDAGWLAARLGRSGPFDRFRTEAWMETASGVRRLDRGRPAQPASTLGQAAAAAGGFLARQVQPDGRFTYRYQPQLDRAADDGVPYSLPRHAGAVWALLELQGRHRDDPRLAAAAERALGWLERRIALPCGAPGTACLLEDEQARLGANALTLVALLAHERASGDGRYRPLARAVADFVASMQRPDGELHHVYLRGEGRVNAEVRSTFASEEAALALVMAHAQLGDQRYLEAAERALDQLTGPKYDFFLGRFVWGADAWTCLAANAAWPHLRHRRYVDFCLGYAGFLRRLQYGDAPGTPWQDFVGHYGLGMVMVPQAPAAAGFTEAVLATLELAQRHGAPTDALRGQARAALHALVRDQLGDQDPRARNPENARGGICRSLVEPEVRVDFVQHAASAMLRGAELGL